MPQHHRMGRRTTHDFEWRDGDGAGGQEIAAARLPSRGCLATDSGELLIAGQSHHPRLSGAVQVFVRLGRKFEVGGTNRGGASSGRAFILVLLGWKSGGCDIEIV
jgi:hypothetical protein